MLHCCYKHLAVVAGFRSAQISLLVLLCVGGSGHLSADEVHLQDGRVLVGEVLSEVGSDPLDIKISSGRVEAVIHIRRHEIVAVERGPSQRQRTVAKLEEAVQAVLADEEASITDKADRLWELSQAFRLADQVIRSRELAEAVVELDRHHVAARAALGFERFRGVWMRPYEIAAARGLILHDGRWLDWAAYREALQDEAATAERRRERLAARQEARRQRQEERARRQRVEDTSLLRPLQVGRSSLHRDSLLRRYLPFYIMSLQSQRSSVCRPQTSLNFNFHAGGDGWGLDASLWY